MSPTRRPLLSLFFCLALAVNLLAPFASASPLFIEICSGHETRLVLADDGPESTPCETCTVCCASLLAPETWAATGLYTSAMASGEAASYPQTTAAAPRPKARAPPFPTV